ncbi:acidic juvenile hormone-suppressible protein 1-like [Aricia agestis]|uniref:acidic juvenile hormone-suppressible protein 1-like n=1 Tax=Aricia agestis TaxID=91739 RepID=UPI001C20174A|nr:acidic juvenile hormone-suppressible protein 1-like [Aricia agestis]
MAWLIFAVIAVLASQGLGDVVEEHDLPRIVADKPFLQKQIDLIQLFFHINEPLVDPEVKSLAHTWSLEKNIENFKNVTALKMFLQIREFDMELPRSVPFNIYNLAHQYQAVNLFNLLISAKDYHTFYKTAVYLRDRINEGMYVYVLFVAIIHHPETQGIVIPQIYEIFPSYFHNTMVMNIAYKINAQGRSMVEHYPETFMLENEVVIRWNETVWPFAHNEDDALHYFKNDYHLNALYYNNHLIYPFWLTDKQTPLLKPHRGEYNWFLHKQLLSHYYMDRLSNGLGEIPDLNLEVLWNGYQSGLAYPNGVPFPVRPDYFNLRQPRLMDHVKRIKILERRILDAIEFGHLETIDGQRINLRTPEALSVLWNVIEGNVDSPNLPYYGNLLALWKELLGNSIWRNYQYVKGSSHVSLEVPSILENYQTAMRDPAFYIMWKRIFNIIKVYQSLLPAYSHEDLALPGVKIQKVDADKMLTYFELNFLNVTNELYMNEVERKLGYDEVSVLVQRPELVHKHFNIRIHVNNDVARKVLVNVFLAPKYDSAGKEIPLHLNTENFFQLDEFVYDLPAGESVIRRNPNDNAFSLERWVSGTVMYAKAMSAMQGKLDFVLDTKVLTGYPRRLILPKGHVGGMPFLMFVSISEYKPAEKLDHDTILAVPRRISRRSYGYPLDRPLYQYQVEDLTNIHIEEVEIFHKHTPEITVPYNNY